MASRRPFLALLLASCSYVIVLDTFAAAVAFPRIEEAFPDTPRTTLAWLSSGYSIALAALLLVSGKLGDRYGRRKVYLRGMAVFTLGAVASAAAPTPALLIAARVVQGGGGAMMVSTSVALALLEYPPERRGVAMGWNGLIGSLASLLGPVLAGNVIEFGGSWRWVFLASVPLCLAVLVFGPRVLQETQASSARSEPIDLVGVVVGVTATALLTFGVIQSGSWGWGDARTLGCQAVALALLALFVQRCRTVPAPLLELGIFGQRRFLVATVSQLGTQLGVFVFFFTTPLFLVNVWGWSAGGVGWAVAIPLVVSFNSVPTGRFADRHGYRGVLVVGGLLAAAAMVWWIVAVGERPHFVSDLLPGLLVYGFGLGMVGITSAAAALVGLESDELAMANSAFQTTRRLAQTLGTAAAVAILGNRSADSLSSFRWVWFLNGAGFLFSALVALAYPARPAAAGREAGRLPWARARGRAQAQPRGYGSSRCGQVVEGGAADRGGGVGLDHPGGDRAASRSAPSAPRWSPHRPGRRRPPRRLRAGGLTPCTAANPPTANPPTTRRRLSATTGPMDTETTRQIVRRFLDARAANDKEAMAGLLTEDAGWYPPPSTGLGPFEGRDTAVAALGGGAIGKVMDVATIKRDVHRIIAEGDTAVVLQGLSGNLVKGGEYRNEYVWIYTCRDGRIARLDEFTDTLHAGRQFGWVKN